jgi:DNA-binding CsgD family transcriptional regulator
VVLRDRAAKAIADVAGAALSAPVGADPIVPILDAMQDSVGADAVGFYGHDRGGWSMPVAIRPAEVWQRIPFDRIPTSAVAAMHPGIDHLVSHRVNRPYGVTDVVSERAWRNSEMGATMHEDWGRNYQFAIPVPTLTTQSTMHWVWVLGRQHQNFSEFDRDVTEHVQPILTVIARHRAIANRLNTDTAQAHDLTQRETVVLRLLADGLTTTAIARRLAISPRTVHKHTERLYRKLSVHARHPAVATAKQLGIL